MTTLEDFLKLNKDKKIWTATKDQNVRQALILMLPLKWNLKLIAVFK